MAQFRPDAAYLRKKTSGATIRAVLNSRGQSLEGQVLELLDTPHTATSISRVLCKGESDATPSPAITSVMSKLLEQDMIELSPDS